MSSTEHKKTQLAIFLYANGVDVLTTVVGARVFGLAEYSPIGKEIASAQESIEAFLLIKMLIVALIISSFAIVSEKHARGEGATGVRFDVVLEKTISVSNILIAAVAAMNAYQIYQMSMR